MENYFCFIKKYKVILLLFIVIILFSYSISQTIVLYKIADYMDTKGLFTQEEVVLKSKLNLSIKDNSKSYALKKLVKFYDTQKEYKKAIVLYEDFLEQGKWQILNRIVLNEPNINEAGVYADLAELYYKDKQYTKAITFYHNALKLKNAASKSVPNSYIYDEAENYNGLVYTYLALNENEKAKTNLNKSFAIIKTLPYNALQTKFSTYLAASDYYLKTKDYTKAEYYANKLFLNIPSSTLPVASYINYQAFYLIIANEQMGKIKFQENKYDEAEIFQQKAKNITEEYYGNNSPQTLCAYNNLLQTLNKTEANLKYIGYIENKLLTTGKNFRLFKDKNIDIDAIKQFCKN